MKNIRTALGVVVLATGLFTVGRAEAGTPFTLEDIYQKLNMQESGGAAKTATVAKHTLDDIMALVNSRAPLAKTGQTKIYQAGDDGTYQFGIALPSQRFTAVNTVGTEVVIRDNFTGLMWTKDANLAPAKKDWSSAVDFCKALNYGGFKDWRLPNVREFCSLTDYGYAAPPLQPGHPFTGIQSALYWTSTTLGTQRRSAWGLNMTDGTIGNDGKGPGCFVWAVRGGRTKEAILGSPDVPAKTSCTLEDIYQKLNMQEPVGAAKPASGTKHTIDDIMALLNSRAPVARTGQQRSYRAGDDGTNLVGVAWPNPRFTAVNTVGTEMVVRDNLTGLMWPKAANLLPQTNWSASVDFCKTLNYGGYKDWRLPNVRELQSLMDYNTIKPPLPSGHPFTGVYDCYYWTGTTPAAAPGCAWMASMVGGSICCGHTKSILGGTLPVRGGQQ